MLIPVICLALLFCVTGPVAVAQESTTSWMQGVADAKKLSELTVPGTHDTCTYNYTGLLPFVKTQTLSLKDQLTAGIRFLDIRCRHINNTFAIHHGSIYLNMNFNDVLNICLDFLRNNPSECIVMSVKHEYDDEGDTRSFEATFDWYTQQTGINVWYLGDKTPVLKDVRGKIVLLRRFEAKNLPKGIDASNWPDNQTFTITNPGATLRVQDEYSPQSIFDPKDEKWAAVRRLFTEALYGSSDTWYINFSSATHTFVPCTPECFASAINPQLEDLAARIIGRAGTLVMDFVQNPLIRAWISLNLTNDRLYGKYNQYLSAGDALSSSGNKFKLVYQADGNLVIYRLSDGKAIWATGTSGKSTGRACMQSDGNFVVYDASGNPVWASNTSGHSDCVVIMQGDGNLVIYDSASKPLWNSNTLERTDRLYGKFNQYLAPNDALYSSGNKFKLVYQADGNLVIYSIPDGKAIWATGTSGKSAGRACMQSDGNFVVYDASGKPVWASNVSWDHTDCVITMQDDGNLVIYDSTGKALWASKG